MTREEFLIKLIEADAIKSGADIPDGVELTTNICDALVKHHYRFNKDKLNKCSKDVVLETLATYEDIYPRVVLPAFYDDDEFLDEIMKTAKNIKDEDIILREIVPYMDKSVDYLIDKIIELSKTYISKKILEAMYSIEYIEYRIDNTIEYILHYEGLSSEDRRKLLGMLLISPSRNKFMDSIPEKYVNKSIFEAVIMDVNCTDYVYDGEFSRLKELVYSDMDWYIEMLKKYPQMLRFELVASSSEDYMRILKEDYTLFREIPYGEITKEMANYYIDHATHIGYSEFMNIPKKLLDEKMVIKILNRCTDKENIFYNIPPEYVTTEMVKEVIGFILEDIGSPYVLDKIFELADGIPDDEIFTEDLLKACEKELSARAKVIYFNYIL